MFNVLYLLNMVYNQFSLSFVRHISYPSCVALAFSETSGYLRLPLPEKTGESQRKQEKCIKIFPGLEATRKPEKAGEKVLYRIRSE